MFVLKMSCIDFNTAMYLLPVEVLLFSTNFYVTGYSHTDLLQYQSEKYRQEDKMTQIGLSKCI